jgi:hypothetical protein
MRIVALTAYLILNKATLLRMRKQPLKNSKPLEALPLKYSGFNYFLPLQTAECGLKGDRKALDILRKEMLWKQTIGMIR